MYDMLRTAARQCPSVSIDGLIGPGWVHLNDDAAFVSGGLARLMGKEYLLCRVCHPTAHFHLRLCMHEAA